MYLNQCLKNLLQTVIVKPIINVLSVYFLVFLNHLKQTILINFQNFFDIKFNPLLSGLRKGFGCQTAWIKNDGKKHLNKYLSVILMDLSKALIVYLMIWFFFKIEAHGLSEELINLLSSYLTNRKQCVLVNSTCSPFETMHKGVPEG